MADKILGIRQYENIDVLFNDIGIDFVFQVHLWSWGHPGDVRDLAFLLHTQLYKWDLHLCKVNTDYRPKNITFISTSRVFAPMKHVMLLKVHLTCYVCIFLYTHLYTE